MTSLAPLFWATALLLFAFTALWVHATRKHDASLVDAGWALGFAFLVGVLAVFSEGVVWRRLTVALIAAIWGLRLGLYIIRRHQGARHEDKRYAALRLQWGAKANAKFLLFFIGQGLADVLLAWPLLLLMLIPRYAFTWIDAVGLLLFAVSIAGSTLADLQLSAWRADTQNRGRTCRHGLWRYSRHPNYFFEWLHWCVYPVIGLNLIGTPLQVWWPLLLFPPALMLYLLLNVTGVPPAERSSLKSRGEDYRRYMAETPRFFPRFFRKSL
jgi:steroid 5-alpha reductase family enzyme